MKSIELLQDIAVIRDTMRTKIALAWIGYDGFAPTLSIYRTHKPTGVNYIIGLQKEDAEALHEALGTLLGQEGL